MTIKCEKTMEKLDRRSALVTCVPGGVGLAIPQRFVAEEVEYVFVIEQPKHAFDEAVRKIIAKRYFCTR
jgi:hypothetical protein